MKNEAQHATIKALESELAIAKAAAERYNKVREVWEAMNEEQIKKWWDGDLFEKLDNFVERGRDAVRVKEKSKEDVGEGT